MSETGKKKIQAVIGSKIDRLEMQARRDAIRWPRKGEAYNGVRPGAWRFDGPHDDTGHLPEDCPVRPLGYEGENYYLVDTSGQVFNSGDKSLGVERVQKLFAGHEDFLCWAWPAYDRKGGVSGFKAEEIRRDLFAACRERGPWTPTDMVRGRGAWRDDRGRLVLHCGEFLFIDGKMEDTGELGDHFYVRRPRATLPWAQPIEAVEDNPAVALVEAFRTWNFVRGDVDVMLLLGWIGVALLGAALDWRPSLFITGDAGTGKSQLQNLLKAIMGRGMISTTNATSAGLYQLVGHDALPIGIDEIEGEDAPEQAQQIIKMARDAASGSIRIRGGANHQGVEFAARSTFIFSAINPPAINKASMSRLALLQLRELDGKSKPPVIPDLETVGSKLLRRVADRFDAHAAGSFAAGEFERLYGQYQDVLREHGHSSRGQNTFGTFLACAHMLLGDEGMDAAGLPFERLDHWGILLAADAAPETSGGQANWAKCIEQILTAPLDAWNKGERMTVGQVLEQLQDERRMEVSLAPAREKLAVCGLGLIEHGFAFEGFGLAIPHQGRDINKLLVDTSFAGRGSDGGWQWALNQGPPEIIRQKIPKRGAKGAASGALDNRITIGGVQRRCTFIGLEELKKWQEG